TPAMMFVVGPILAATGGVLLIAFIVTGGNGRVLCWWPLRQTGRISYGLYLWNVPIVGALLPHLRGVPLIVRASVLFTLTYGFALVSYRWVELPYLRKKPTRPLFERRADATDAMISSDAEAGKFCVPRYEHVADDDVDGVRQR